MRAWRCCSTVVSLPLPLRAIDFLRVLRWRGRQDTRRLAHRSGTRSRDRASVYACGRAAIGPLEGASMRELLFDCDECDRIHEQRTSTDATRRRHWLHLSTVMKIDACTAMHTSMYGPGHAFDSAPGQRTQATSHRLMRASIDRGYAEDSRWSWHTETASRFRSTDQRSRIAASEERVHRPAADQVPRSRARQSRRSGLRRCGRSSVRDGAPSAGSPARRAQPKFARRLGM